MDFKAMYRKLTTAAEAAQGWSRAATGWTTAGAPTTPWPWTRPWPPARELDDVKVRGGVTMWMPEISKADDAGEHFTWHSWHMQRHRPEDHCQGHGLFLPHALFRAAPLLSRKPGPRGRGHLPGAPPWTSTATSTSALAPSHLAEMCDKAKTSLWRSTEPAPRLRPVRLELNIADVTYVVEGDNPPSPAGLGRRRHRGGPHRGQPRRAPRSPTAPACSWASAVCPTPSVP